MAQENLVGKVDVFMKEQELKADSVQNLSSLLIHQMTQNVTETLVKFPIAPKLSKCRKPFHVSFKEKLKSEVQSSISYQAMELEAIRISFIDKIQDLKSMKSFTLESNLRQIDLLTKFLQNLGLKYVYGSFYDKMFFVSSHAYSFEESIMFCKRFQAKLYEAESEQETKRIIKALHKLGYESWTWIGINNTLEDGEFRHLSSNETISWSNWNSGEPTGSEAFCVDINKDAVWDADPCINNYRALCEYEIDLSML